MCAMPAAVPLATDSGMQIKNTQVVAKFTVPGSIQPIATGLS